MPCVMHCLARRIKALDDGLDPEDLFAPHVPAHLDWESDGTSTTDSEGDDSEEEEDEPGSSGTSTSTPGKPQAGLQPTGSLIYLQTWLQSYVCLQHAVFPITVPC